MYSLISETNKGYPTRKRRIHYAVITGIIPIIGFLLYIWFALNDNMKGKDIIIIGIIGFYSLGIISNGILLRYYNLKRASIRLFEMVKPDTFLSILKGVVLFPVLGFYNLICLITGYHTK